jgi:predicted AlkP superfamily phosphohydrolase/phosphomutase
MLERISDDTTVIVMSDHGFGPLHYVVNLNLFLLEQGLLHLKRGAWTQIKSGLFHAGITPASLWHLVERVGLQNYVWHVSKSTRNKVVSKFLSFNDVDWSRTLAYSIGHVGQIYVNVKGREPEGIVEPGPEYEAVRQQVTEVLQKLRHPESGQPLTDQVIPGDRVCHGPCSHRGPDLHVVLDGYRAISFPLFATDNHIVTRQIRGDSGCHRLHGILIAWGSGIRSKLQLRIKGARILDLAPTVLHLMGLPVPEDMDGRVLTEALSTSRPVELRRADSTSSEGTALDQTGQEAQAGLSEEETAEVEERLRALGYLG